MPFTALILSEAFQKQIKIPSHADELASLSVLDPEHDYSDVQADWKKMEENELVNIERLSRFTHTFDTQDNKWPSVMAIMCKQDQMDLTEFIDAGRSSKERVAFVLFSQDSNTRDKSSWVPFSYCFMEFIPKRSWFRSLVEVNGMIVKGEFCPALLEGGPLNSSH